MLPDGWCVATVADVALSMQNIYRPASAYADDGTPCLRMYNIDEGHIVLRDLKRMRLTASELDQFGLLPGDILVNRVNSRELVGKAAVIPRSIGPCVFESKNIRLRVDHEKINPAYLTYRLFQEGSRFFDKNAQQTVGMASINQSQLGSFPIPLAPRDEQDRIVAEIEKQFTRIDSGLAGLFAAQRRARTFRIALLQAAVSGRLVPTEAQLAARDGRTYQSGRELLAKVLDHQSSYQANIRAGSVGPGTTRLPSLPDGWIWASLSQLLGELRNGVSVKPDAAKGTPILRISAVRPMSVDLTDIRFLGSSEGDFATFTIRSGDLLFTRYNGTRS